jgi:hypothetical protein
MFKHLNPRRTVIDPHHCHREATTFMNHITSRLGVKVSRATFGLATVDLLAAAVRLAMIGN